MRLGNFASLPNTRTTPTKKAALLINEHKCYCQIGRLDKAVETMREIRVLPIQDSFVKMIVNYGDACMAIQLGDLKEGLSKIETLFLG